MGAAAGGAGVGAGIKIAPVDPECRFVGTLHVFDGEETKKALHLWDAAVVTFFGIKKKYPFLSVVAVASTGLYLVLLHCSFTTAPTRGVAPKRVSIPVYLQDLQ